MLLIHTILSVRLFTKIEVILAGNWARIYPILAGEFFWLYCYSWSPYPRVSGW